MALAFHALFETDVLDRLLRQEERYSGQYFTAADLRAHVLTPQSAHEAQIGRGELRQVGEHRGEAVRIYAKPFG